MSRPGTNPRPDWFFLVCEEWDAAGGESFLVDGQVIIITAHLIVSSISLPSSSGCL
jgi:hypothetical protein